jgi:hypothetical protein
LLVVAAEKGLNPETAAAEMARAMKVARFGEPAKVAWVVAFLAPSAGGYCQGAIVDVDGGQTRGNVLRIRLTEGECQAVDAAANAKGLQTSRWARSELIALARKVLGKN